MLLRPHKCVLNYGYSTHQILAKVKDCFVMICFASSHADFCKSLSTVSLDIYSDFCSASHIEAQSGEHYFRRLATVDAVV